VRVSFATDGGSGESNEDTVAVGGDVVVVLDGVSRWYTDESGCRHGTVWYVRRLAERVLEHTVPGVSLASAVGEAIRDVADLHRDTCDLTHPWSPAATVAVLRESEEIVDYLILADCVVVVETTTGTAALTDTRLAELLRRARHPDASPELRQHLKDGLHRLRNHPDGYWVASADPAAAANAVTGSIARDEIRRVALLTDGASCLVDDYSQASWEELLRLGPEALIAEVRRYEKSDPDRLRWPRGKVHDDATAAFCTF
jgi:protein phosphatase 2C-like protein